MVEMTVFLGTMTGAVEARDSHFSFHCAASELERLGLQVGMRFRYAMKVPVFVLIEEGIEQFIAAQYQTSIQRSGKGGARIQFQQGSSRGGPTLFPIKAVSVPVAWLPTAGVLILAMPAGIRTQGSKKWVTDPNHDPEAAVKAFLSEHEAKIGPKQPVRRSPGFLSAQP
jgi:hypothetical protein